MLLLKLSISCFMLMHFYSFLLRTGGIHQRSFFLYTTYSKFKMNKKRRFCITSFQRLMTEYLPENQYMHVEKYLKSKSKSKLSILLGALGSITNTKVCLSHKNNLDISEHYLRLFTNSWPILRIFAIYSL